MPGTYPRKKVANQEKQEYKVVILAEGSQDGAKPPKPIFRQRI